MAKILVVDDHPHIVRLVQRELERDGHQVVTAADGEEALRQVHREQPALMVLDVVMPKMNGFEVLDAVKSDPTTEAIVVIMLTVKTKDAEMTHGLHLGADWYVSKPFVPGDLSALVRRFLGGEPASAEPQSREGHEGGQAQEATPEP
jgi:two-component system, OmpR family, alkaline phosphatase synthesis response regulator PhoP